MNAPSGIRAATSSSALRKTGFIHERGDGLRSMALQLLRRAQLLLAALGALEDRHFELGLECGRGFVGEVHREGLALFRLRLELAAAGAEIFFEKHALRFAPRQRRAA